MPNPDPNDGLPEVPDGTEAGSGDSCPPGFHMDVQDSGDLFVTGLVPAHDLVMAMQVLSDVTMTIDVEPDIREESWELCKAFSRELLDRSRKTVKPE